MKTEVKKFYEMHEGMYKHRKAAGHPGWDCEEVINEFKSTIEKSLKTSAMPSGGKVLELGCGAGDMSLFLAEKGFEVYGIDISPTAIEWAKEKAAERNLQVDFRVGSVLDLSGFSDNVFDYILDGHCLHCIIGEDRKVFLTEALRVLKYGGVLFSETMCGEVKKEELKKRFDENTRCLMIKDIAERYIGLPEDIIKEFTCTGFKILNSDVSYDQDGPDNLRIHATKDIGK